MSDTHETQMDFIDPVEDLDQTGPLVLGPGARKDASSGTFGPLPKLSSGQNAAVQLAKKYAMEQSIKMVLVKQTLAHQQHQAKSLQRHQAVILMCRIYVGSINFEVKEETIRQAFIPFGPIRTITMSWDPVSRRHKGFGFVEYEVPEGAQLALEQMNGVIICGRNIKVGRPSNMPQAQAIIVDINEEAKRYNRIYIASIHSDLTKDDIRSVFEAFGQITACDLPCGPIPGRHKGYCFIEYATEQSAIDAIGSMNLFDLGGQYLRVGRAITPPDTSNLGPLPVVGVSSLPTASAVAAAAATAKIQALDAVATNLGLNAADIMANKVMMAAASIASNPSAAVASAVAAAAICNSRLGGFGQTAANVPPPGVAHLFQPGYHQQAFGTNPEQSSMDVSSHQQKQDDLKKLMEHQEVTTLQQQEHFSIKGKAERSLVMQKLMRRETESVVVVLRNMVTPDEVDEDLQDEVQEESSKFGTVERVIIYQERESEDDESDAWVKIFVEFKSAKSAKAARDALHGRYFGGRIISAQIYDQNLYDDNDLSG